MPSITPTPQPIVADDRTVISSRPPLPAPQGGYAAPALADATSLVGQSLDHFDLQEFIGGGGMGVVFRALDTRLNRIVALKVLARDQADAEEKVRRFKNEAQSAARLDHDHIARVYFVGQDRGLHYIVFEYIEGVNLRDLVARRGPLPLDEAINYTLQIAEALAHAASRDVVHRDIKPSNLLITPQGRAKLVDMGLARLHQVEPKENELTSSGVTLGTFDYISPEQARDPRCADVRSDIYSLGCTLFYMLTARPPFPEGNVLQKLLQHNNEPPPDPANYNPDLPEQVSRLMRKMLAKEPRRRHQTAGELVADLLVLIDQLGLPTSGVDPTAWAVATPPRVTLLERHLPWFAAVAVLIAAVAAMEIFWGTGSEDPQEPLQSNLLSARPLSPTEVSHQGAEEGNRDEPTPATVTSPPEETPKPAQPAEAANDTSTASTPSNNGAGAASVAETPAVPTTSPPAEESTSTAANTAESLRPPLPRAGYRIVNPAGNPLVEYPTLRQACLAAANNDIIELNFNGRIEERPFKLNRVKLTIKAAENCSPTIAFKHPQPLTTDPQAMITVVGGELRLINVGLELDIPARREPASWAMFQTLRAQEVRLENCWLTIRNAGAMSHPLVSFFEIKAPPDASAMAMADTAAMEHTVNVQLLNCVARGEATLLRCDELQPVELTWNNGLLATSERLLAAQGNEMANKTNGQIAVYLRHVTAHVHGGLCLLANGEGSRPMLRTELHCRDSILLGGADVPLIEQSGVSSVEEFESNLEWDGSRYFYSGVNTFWKISSFATAMPTQDPVKRSFDDWQKHWNENEGLANQEIWNRVLWKQLPATDRPFHTHTPADYALDDSSPDNQARQNASDGWDAGMLPAALPPLPATTPVEIPTASPKLTPPQEEEEF
jgi:serine/threonine-protein kinase